VECKIKIRLEQEWRDASEMYSRLSALVIEKEGASSSSIEDSRGLHRSMQAAGELSEQLRRDLDEHVKGHGC